jgi:drug/metabolite transporter (DMT)-like permease
MIIEASVVFVILAVLCWAIGDFSIQRSVRKIGNIEALAYSGIFGFIILIPFVWNDLGTLLNFSNLFVLVFLGVLTFFAAIANFESLKRGKLSVVEVLLEIELPATVILGILFFEESLTLFQWVLISFIFVGIILIASKGMKLREIFKKAEKGAYLGIIAAIGMGLVNFFTAFSARQVSPIMAIWMPWIIYGLISLAIIWQREGLNRFGRNGWKFRKIVFMMCVFDTLAWLFYAFATAKGEVGVLTAITESYPVLTLFMGLWINKERISRKQYLGAAVTLVAAITLGFTI